MATSTYFLVLTNTGRDLIQAAYDAGTKVDLVEMAFGNSGGAYVEPSVEFTALVGEFGRNEITDGTSGGYLIDVQSYVDSTYAGETLREFGVYDADGNLIIYGSYPPSEIASADDPDYVQIIIEAKLELDNAESVTISVSPVFDYATEEKAGISRVASQTLVDEGTDHTTFITPKTLSSKTIVRSDTTQTITGKKTFKSQVTLNNENPASGNQADIFHNGLEADAIPHLLRSMRENQSALWIWEKVLGGSIFYSTGTDGSANSKVWINVSGGSWQAAPTGSSWGHDLNAALQLKAPAAGSAYNLFKVEGGGAKMQVLGAGGADVRLYTGMDSSYINWSRSRTRQSSQAEEQMYSEQWHELDYYNIETAMYSAKGLYGWRTRYEAASSRDWILEAKYGSKIAQMIRVPINPDSSSPMAINHSLRVSSKDATPFAVERPGLAGVNCNIRYSMPDGSNNWVNRYAGSFGEASTNWGVAAVNDINTHWTWCVNFDSGDSMSKGDVVAFYGATKSVSTLEASLSRLDRMAPKPIERVTSYVAVEKLIEIVEMQQKQIDSLEEKVIALGGVDERKR